MDKNLKKVLRTFIPKVIRPILWDTIPKFYIVNTFILTKPEYCNRLPKIDSNYIIADSVCKIEKYIRFESDLGNRKSTQRIESRLNTGVWIPLSIIDSTNGDIAYNAWIITKSIPYFEEFGINIKQGDYLLKDGSCLPQYRHQGLHTRMELERINYCIQRGAKNIYIQIHNSNKKGIKSVLGNGYRLYQKNIVIQWPVFDIYRSLVGFIKNPFRKVVK